MKTTNNLLSFTQSTVKYTVIRTHMKDVKQIRDSG